MKKIKLFEEFTEEERKFLIDNDLTYIRKNKEYPKKIGLIYDKIREYDISNFDIVETYNIIIYPDETFKKLLVELNETLNNEDKVDINIKFELNINKELFNEINLDFYLPDPLKGLNLGYNIYILIAKKYNYITTKFAASNFAINIWYKLIVNSDFYCFTSNLYSGIIYKNISNIELKNILDKIKKIEKLIFDEKIKEKIIEIYGSFENYKRKK